MVYNGIKYQISLKGNYQYFNASVVIEIINLLKLSGYKISDDDLKYGLLNTTWMARFEFIRPDLIIDGSHNPGGISELKKDLLALNKKIGLVIAMMSDKECSESVKYFSQITDTVVITKLPIPRCCDPVILQNEFKLYNINPVICEDIKDAVLLARKSCDIVCVCGSLYLAGEARKIFN